MGIIIGGLFVIIALAILTLGSFGAFYIYRQRKNEHLAIREFASKSILQIDNVLMEIDRSKTDDLPQIKIEMLNDINLCINNYTHEANNNIDRLMDSDFYSKALKGIVPFGEGRKDFEDSFRNIEKQIINRDGLSKELEEIGVKYEKILRDGLLSRISKVELNLSEKTKETLAKLKDNPSKTLRVLGMNGKFKNIAAEDINKEVAFSIGEFGILGLGIITVIDPETVGELIGDTLRDIIGSDLVEQFVLEIKEWLIQEVGEEIGTEIIETLGTALVPVIPIVFLVLKARKYLNLYNRVFVEKEPLQKMRKSAKESVLKNLNKVGKTVYDSLTTNLDKAIKELEKNLVDSRDKKEKQYSDFIDKNKVIPDGSGA